MTRRRIALVLLVLAVSIRPAAAQVAFGTGGANGADNGGSTSSVSWSFDTTLSAAASDLLLVAVQGDTAADDVTGCTFNSVAMTLVGKALGTGGRWTYLYRLFAPATGSHTAACAASTSHYLFGTAGSWSGVAALGNTTTNSGVSTTLVTFLTTTQANAWIATAGSGNNGILAGTGASNARASYATFGTPGLFDAGAVASPSNQSVTITSGGGSDPLAAVLLELLPNAITAVPHRFGLLGVGR